LAFVSTDFQVWAKGVDALMRDGQDVAWVFSGKSRSTEQVLEKEFAKMKWNFKEIRLVYDAAAMQNMYWVRERGFANGSTNETLFVCWKGRVPRCFPATRLHVDVGSSTYYDTMNKVPVCRLPELTMVSAEVHSKSQTLFGAEPTEPDWK